MSLLRNVHLVNVATRSNRMSGMEAVDNDNDMYSGFGSEHVAPALQTDDLDMDENFQSALRTSYGRRPPGTSSRLATSMTSNTPVPRAAGSTGLVSSRGTTGASDGLSRPMTGIRGAGFPGTSSGRKAFDPLNQASSSASKRVVTGPEFDNADQTPEEKIKALEKKVMELVEESCMCNGRNDLKIALDRAKEASSKERSLIRLREQSGLSESHNLDLTFSVLFNLANQYSDNGLDNEAINTLQVITKNRMFNNAGRLRVNLGNVYFRQGHFAKAIKLYRMALDQVPNSHKSLRIRIMHNIGILFVHMGQHADAVTSFEWIMSEQPDLKTALHLILCYFIMGDKDRVKKGFQQLLEVPVEQEDETKYTSVSDDPASNLILEAIKNDTLRKMERARRQDAENTIITAAKLIAPMIEESFTQGYNWCVDSVKLSPQHAALAQDLEINKAVMYLRQKDFSNAVATLKSFEKQANNNTKVASTAATNLAFLYFLQGDIEQAEKYGDAAVEADGYNAAAFVNLGNCYFVKDNIKKARELYSLGVESDANCVEALYNLGLCEKRLGDLESSLESFFKLQSIVRHNAQVMYHIGHVQELLGRRGQAMEWYFQVISLVPTDPHMLHKMGQMYENEGDKQQAFQYHVDAYRNLPANLQVIDWLGSYFIEMQVSEKAIPYFERAALIEPEEVKWHLMIASCYRRSGNYQRALDTYRSVHRRFPENIESLKFLVKLSSDLGLKEANEYAVKLRQVQKNRLNEEGNTANELKRDTSALSQRLDEVEVEEMSAESLFNSGRVDVEYSDPLGPLPERPKTAAIRASQMNNEDEFRDADVDSELLPD